MISHVLKSLCFVYVFLMFISTSLVFMTSSARLTRNFLIIILILPLTFYSALIPVHGGGPFWMGDGFNDRCFRECH